MTTYADRDTYNLLFKINVSQWQQVILKQLYLHAGNTKIL